MRTQAQLFMLWLHRHIRMTRSADVHLQGHAPQQFKVAGRAIPERMPTEQTTGPLVYQQAFKDGTRVRVTVELLDEHGKVISDAPKRVLSMPGNKPLPLVGT